jgi:hypothetical protein
MPRRSPTRTVTDHRACKWCGVRIIWARTPDGKKLPPVEYGPDPIGTVAVTHKMSGAYTGRFLAKDEQPVPPETRHAVHHCEGMERQHRHRRGKSANQRPTASRSRRTPAPVQPTLDLGTLT